MEYNSCRLQCTFIFIDYDSDHRSFFQTKDNLHSNT